MRFLTSLRGLAIRTSGKKIIIKKQKGHMEIDQLVDITCQQIVFGSKVSVLFVCLCGLTACQRAGRKVGMNVQIEKDENGIHSYNP